ncbi:hypothetical protein [Candidatus Poriferisodalis sp.]|uniref:hypothetical protein n=1 Tax=Candidatus Poriferisodalis sp. TaxID=3101277 RepID=UPI003B5BF320
MTKRARDEHQPDASDGRPAAADYRARRRKPLSESGATASLELLALTPLLALLVLFVLWSGRSARAGLIADLAAEEAAVAAALCCEGPAGTADADEPPSSAQRELMVETVLASRPGLDYLCLGGPKPAGDGTAGFVTETGIDFAASPNPGGFARSARVIEVHFDCETDGAVAPVRGLFPTVTMRGRSSHVTVLTDGPRLAISAAAVAEGEVIVFVATLTKPTSADIELEYYTQDRTATSTSISSDPGEMDFESIPAETPALTIIPAGEVSAEVLVATLEDDVCEGDETFDLVVHANGDTLRSAANDNNSIQFTTAGTITDESDCADDTGL